MTFKDWVASNGGLGYRRQDALWRRIKGETGVGYSGQRKWLLGASEPTPRHVLAILRMTDGAVGLRDWPILGAALDECDAQGRS